MPRAKRRNVANSGVHLIGPDILYGASSLSHGPVCLRQPHLIPRSAIYISRAQLNEVRKKVQAINAANQSAASADVDSGNTAESTEPVGLVDSTDIVNPGDSETGANNKGRDDVIYQTKTSSSSRNLIKSGKTAVKHVQGLPPNSDGKVGGASVVSSNVAGTGAVEGEVGGGHVVDGEVDRVKTTGHSVSTMEGSTNTESVKKATATSSDTSDSCLDTVQPLDNANGESSELTQRCFSQIKSKNNNSPPSLMGKQLSYVDLDNDTEDAVHVPSSPHTSAANVTNKVSIRLGSQKSKAIKVMMNSRCDMDTIPTVDGEDAAIGHYPLVYDCVCYYLKHHYLDSLPSVVLLDTKHQSHSLHSIKQHHGTCPANNSVSLKRENESNKNHNRD